MGQVIVNIPVVAIILITIILLSYIGLPTLFTCPIASLMGWLLWSRLLDLWKKWAFSLNVSPDRLFKLGKFGFINFYRYRIFDDHEK